MRREYEWSPLRVLVEADDDGPSYQVRLASEGFLGTPMAVDAHLGADDAARSALDIYRRALDDPRKFLAGERMESRHMASQDGELHVRWADAVVREAALLGARIQAAIQAAELPLKPVDVGTPVDTYLGLTAMGQDLAVAGLVSEGRSPADAKEILAQRARQDFAAKWRQAPGRRLPTAVRE